jgi:hypothetical protein
MQFSSASHLFISLRSKYSPQHPVLKFPHWKNGMEDVKNERRRKEEVGERMTEIKNGKKRMKGKSRRDAK